MAYCITGRKLLQEMAGICKTREKILAQLGLEVLASSKVPPLEKLTQMLSWARSNW